MEDTENRGSCKADVNNYGGDFLLLSLKEKRGILKNAKTLLKLQKDNALLSAEPPLRRSLENT
jgi:hypothetical protein